MHAAKDALWCAVNQFAEMPYHVVDMPDELFCAWQRSGLPSTQPSGGASQSQSWRLLHGDRLIKMRDTMFQRPLATIEQLVGAGKTIESHETASLRRFSFSTSAGQNLRPETVDDQRHQTEQRMKQRNQRALAERRERDADRFAKEVHMAAQEDQEQGLDQDSSVNPDISQRWAPEKERILKSSPLAVVQIGTSASSKMDYILSQIKRYAAKEKFLIFSGSQLTLEHTAEGLNLAGVKCLSYTSSVNIRQREQYVMTFETSELYRVMLMDLKHGARGM